MPAVDPGKERNVGIVGHGGVGKTMLLEHILHDAKITKRMGSIEDGNTVFDIQLVRLQMMANAYEDNGNNEQE